jgi:hypothetical protein
VGVGSTEFGGGAFPKLDGVPHDVKSVAAMLSDRGFDVSVPNTASELTAEGVGKALVELIDQSVRDDLSVIYLTGHGYRYPDSPGDEADGWDEAFVCGDRPIPDDWFRDQLWPRVKSGAKIVVIVDACHSESISIGFAPPPLLPTPMTKVVPPSGYYRLVLAACRDQETALERGAFDGGGGVVTTQMLETLGSTDVSYRELWTQVATNVAFNYQGQSIGKPRYVSLGPDDDLLDRVAFAPP